MNRAITITLILLFSVLTGCLQEQKQPQPPPAPPPIEITGDRLETDKISLEHYITNYPGLVSNIGGRTVKANSRLVASPNYGGHVPGYIEVGDINNVTLTLCVDQVCVTSWINASDIENMLEGPTNPQELMYAVAAEHAAKNLATKLMPTKKKPKKDSL